MIDFLKKIFETKPTKTLPIDAAGARALIKNRDDAIRADYESRRQGMLDSVYENIRECSAKGDTYFIIMSASSACFRNYTKWDRQDLDWFFEDFEKTFVDQGYDIIIGKNGFDEYRLKISW